MREACRTRLLSTLLAAAMIFLSGASAWGLDLSDGRIKLTLHQGIGRFSISCQNKSGVYVPLLSAQDPRTTTLSLVIGNKIYRMGESSEFSETVEKTLGGGQFVWKSSFLVVTESFTFIASIGSKTTDGILIAIKLHNVSERDYTAGARYLFDTYLGEPSFVHFRTDAISQMSKEQSLAAKDKALYWVSPLQGDSDDMGFQVMTSGPGVTVPDRVVFANWKRLSDSSWSYDTSQSRNFSQLPYSVNDSAACQYYDPRPLPHGTESTIVIAAGDYSKSGFSGLLPTTTEGFAAAVEQSLAAGRGASDSAKSAQADLDAANTIISRLDTAMESGAALTDQDITLLEAALQDLKSRADRYASSQ